MTYKVKKIKIMNNISLTVFTPTYNRAHTLPKLYESLLNQTDKDFEWLVIDDGSTDGTEKLIKSYIEEGRIQITYFKQENQGKHIAINKSSELAKGDYIITLDSDDYITENCIEVCRSLKMKTSSSDFAGFTFVLALDEEIKGNEILEWLEEGKIKLDFQHEMSFVLKKSVLRKFLFPVYQGEKFCQESFILSQILKNYKVLFTSHVLAYGDYLEDGLTSNMYKKMLESPRYTMISLKQRIENTKEMNQKRYFAKVYWDVAMKTGGGFFKNIKRIPIGLTFYIYFKKIFKI